MNQITSFDALVAAAKRPAEGVEIKSLNGAKVYFRHMSAKERDEHESSAMNAKGEVDVTKIKGIRQRLVALTICDEDGNALPDANAAKLGHLDAEVIDELAEAAAKINGMREGSKDEAGNA